MQVALATATIDSALATARILVIDDEPAMARSIGRALTRSRAVTTAYGGADALELLAEDDSYDAIVCDVMMPKVDGPAVYRHIVRHYPHLQSRFLFCTAGTLHGATQAYLDRLDKPTLIKPFDRQVLRQWVAHLILSSQK